MWLDTSLKQETNLFTLDIKKELFDTWNSEIECYRVNNISIQSSINRVTNFEILPFNIFASFNPNLKQNITLGGILSPEIKIIRKVDNNELEIPLMLTVSYRRNSVFIENEYLNLWGEGDSVEEAIKSFEDFFLYDFESYKDTPVEKMDILAQEKLRRYKYLLKIS